MAHLFILDASKTEERERERGERERGEREREREKERREERGESEKEAEGNREKGRCAYLPLHLQPGSSSSVGSEASADSAESSTPVLKSQECLRAQL